MTIRLLTTEDGYRMISDGRPEAGRRSVVYEHRLTAYAWGILDGLDDEREVHHLDRSKMHTAESNLVALDRDEHIEIHINETDPGSPPPKWVIDSLPFAVRNDLVDGDGRLREEAVE